MRNWIPPFEASFAFGGDRKYQKILISIISTVAVLGVVLFLFGGANSRVPKVCFKKTCIDVEIADSKEERVRGLMFREKLEKDKGMLFVFEQEDIHPFWMENTRIPLDMIWISKDKEIVFISKNVQPCADDGICPTITPDEDALYVLEINAGAADKIGIKVGDRIDFKI